MTLTAELEQLQTEMVSRMPEDVQRRMAEVNAQLSARDLERNALQHEDRIPAFTLDDHLGRAVSSETLLQRGALVLNFYRGSWCPYCNLELKALSEHQDAMRDLGAELVAISPERPEGGADSVLKHQLKFPVLSDPGNRVARRFGLVFDLPAALREIYRGFDIDLPGHNGDESWQLPMPATYVVNRDGVIRYVFVDSDYTRRAEPSEVLDALRELHSSAA